MRALFCARAYLKKLKRHKQKHRSSNVLRCLFLYSSVRALALGFDAEVEYLARHLLGALHRLEARLAEVEALQEVYSALYHLFQLLARFHALSQHKRIFRSRYLHQLRYYVRLALVAVAAAYYRAVYLYYVGI